MAKRYEMNAGKILANHIIKETENAASESPKGDSGPRIDEEKMEILRMAMRKGLHMHLDVEPIAGEEGKHGMSIEISGTGAAMMAGVQALAEYVAKSMVADGASQEILVHFGAALFTTVAGALEKDREEDGDEEH